MHLRRCDRQSVADMPQCNGNIILLMLVHRCYRSRCWRAGLSLKGMMSYSRAKPQALLARQD